MTDSGSVRYELEFEDTFDAFVLDTSRWFPYHLPHWSNREQAAARYELGGGLLRLRIEQDQPRGARSSTGRFGCRRCRPASSPGTKAGGSVSTVSARTPSSGRHRPASGSIRRSTVGSR